MSASPGAPAPVETGGHDERPAERDRPSAIRRLGLERYAIVIVLVAMIVAFGVDIPSTFLSIGNLSNILGSQAVLFILVMAVMLPTIMGNFVDLSLGPRWACPRWSWPCSTCSTEPRAPRLPGGCRRGGLVGLFNVFFVVCFDNDPLIMTLGTITVVQGIIYIVSGNNSVGIVSTSLSNWVFTNQFLSIPLEFYYGLAIFLVV